MGGDGLAETFEGGQRVLSAEHLGQCVFETEDSQVVEAFYLVTFPGAAVDSDASSADSAGVGHQ